MSDKKAHTFEERIVHCDGREYRVTRTAGQVTFLDARGDILKNSREKMFETQESIFLADESFWCNWIRQCRGGGA